MPATTKQGWDALPAGLREQVTAYVGAEVADAVTRQGGFTPGVATRLRFTDGTRAFLKATAASLNPDSSAMHRREADVAGRLDDPATPRLLTVVDDGDWIGLLFEHARGDHPRVPWGRRPFEVVAAQVHALHERLTPSPVAAPALLDHGDYDLSRWADFSRDHERAQRHGLTAADIDRLSAATADLGRHLEGNTLLHGDLRADQILVAGMRITVVDWPHACIGPGWADLALMVPSMLAADRRLDVDTVVSLSAELRAAPATALRALLTAVAGHLLWQCDEPDPPGLPSIRGFQRAQGRALLPWVLGAAS